MFELDLNLTAELALHECRRRGLVVRSEREPAGRAGSRHWHLGISGRRGTLELNEWESRVWVKVHPLRDGGGRASLRASCRPHGTVKSPGPVFRMMLL
jgi:hypothetical protein